MIGRNLRTGSLWAAPAIAVNVGTFVVVHSISGCSLTIDANRVQCSVTADCRARGSQFGDSRCEDNFCVPITSSLEEESSDERGSDESRSTSTAPDTSESEQEASQDAGAPSQEVASPATCERTSDCAAEDVCFEEVCVDPFECPLEASSDAVTVTTRVSDVFGTPLPGVATRLCRNIDPGCQNPVAVLVADEEGVLTFELPAAFTGYLEFTVDQFFPQLQVLPPNPPDGTELSGVSLSPVQFVARLGLAVGAQADPERGHLFLTFLGCYGRAAGIQLSSNRSDDQSILFYVLDGVPSPDLTETTVAGSCGFLNFPAGNSAVTLTNARSQRELTKLTFVVRPSFLTVAMLRPAIE
jgi:hypothetical protein